MPPGALRSITVRSADGTAIYAQSMGIHSSSKPHLLYLHGNSSSSLIFDKQFYDPALNERCFQVRMDLRGMGKSDAPPLTESGLAVEGVFDGERQANDVKAVMDAFGLIRPILIAWSYGTVVAIDYIEHHALSSISGLVLIAGIVGHPKDISQYFSPTLSRIQSLSQSNPHPAEFKEALDTFVTAMVYDQEKLGEWTMLALKGMALQTSNATRAASWTRKQSYDKYHAEAWKVLPKLVVFGEQGNVSYASGIDHNRDLWTPSLLTTHVINHSGHMPHFETPEEFNGLLLDWIEKLGLNK